MGIVEEEADETLFWLEIITEMEIMEEGTFKRTYERNDEIVAIVVTSIKTAKKNR